MLATDPRVLLFDEPLSALDRNLRDTLKYSILALQRRTKKTAIYVTHDQSEAFAISDRIFVMNRGRIEQSGTQFDIYLRPQSEFVANFVGDNNALRGEVVAVEPAEPGAPQQVTVAAGPVTATAIDATGLRAGDRVVLFVRPEHIRVVPNGPGRDEPGVVAGAVDQLVFEGPTVRMVVDVDGVPLRVAVSGTERLELLGSERQRVFVRLEDVALVREPAATQA